MNRVISLLPDVSRSLLPLSRCAVESSEDRSSNEEVFDTDLKTAITESISLAAPETGHTQVHYIQSRCCSCNSLSTPLELRKSKRLKLQWPQFLLIKVFLVTWFSQITKNSAKCPTSTQRAHPIVPITCAFRFCRSLWSFEAPHLHVYKVQLFLIRKACLSQRSTFRGKMFLWI